MVLMVEKGGRWRSIAYGTTCEIDINAEMVETGSGMTGLWRTLRKRKLQWVGTTGHLMADTKQEVDILEMVMSKEPVRVCIGTIAPHTGSVAADEQTLDGRLKMTGEAYVTRATISARRGDVVTISATMEGNGELEVEWA